MRAVILVGGEGTRMRPLTTHTPKPMLPVANRPFLEYVLEYLKRYGITDVVLSMCYRPDVIESHFGDGSAFGVNLTYVVEDKPLGTAGAVKNAEKHLSEACFVFNGDILTDLDLSAMLEFHRSRKAKISIALTPVEDPTAYGLVETDTDRRIQRFIEKPSADQITTNLINAGTYIIEPEVLQFVPADTFYMFERGLFPLLLERGDLMCGYPSHSYWIDIGTPQKYLTVHRDVLHGHIALNLPGRPLASDIRVGENCSIDPSAKITGPVVLGDRVSIGPNASIDGPVAIGDGCVIGAESVLEDVIMWPDCRVGSKATLHTAVVGARCELAEGVSITTGAIVADDCTIASGNRLDHGIRLWPGAKLGPTTITF
jgi:mannose-1-phosphate guanylyltransferase